MNIKSKYNKKFDLYLSWHTRYQQVMHWWNRIPIEWRSFVDGLQEEKALCEISLRQISQRNKQINFLLTEQDSEVFAGEESYD